MGLTTLAIFVANPRKRRKSARVRCIVDTDATYSVIRSKILEGIGIRPDDEITLALADGTEITRSVGEALFQAAGKSRVSPVIFGEEKDANLLGGVALEAMGLFLDPLERTLKPTRVMLA
ncbi:MAG: aspartyl protease [Candidatus Hydrogenedentota bacterium]|nr:MAG: aspartyl protease [Candidatus Hydrogenedentota bacterium]